MFTLTLATAMLYVNVLPLKVTTARVSAYMLTITFATATLSFNVLPLTLNVNVFPLKVATLTVSAYMLTLHVCNCFNGCKCKA